MSQSTLTFLTESLPEFTQFVPANFQLEAVGGTPPYTFDITQGTLPTAMTLSASGLISGTPNQVADTTVFVKLSDAVNDNITQAFAVRVAEGVPPPDDGNGNGNGGCLGILTKLFPRRRA